jgi:hypothetical protein
MRKIFIAIAASLLIALSSAVTLKQVHSKVLQNAQAHQPSESKHHATPRHHKEDFEERAQLKLKQEDEEAEDEEEDDDEEEDPEDDDEEEPHELAQRMRGYAKVLGD